MNLNLGVVSGDLTTLFGFLTHAAADSVAAAAASTITLCKIK